MQRLPVRVHRRPDTEDGHLWCLLDTDTVVSQIIRQTGSFEESLLAKALSYVREGSEVVDVGANCGAWTIPLACAAGDNGRVHAFELQRIIYQQLNCNIFLNGIGNVHTHHAPLGDVAGRIVSEPPDIDYYSGGANVGGGYIRSDPSLPIDSRLAVKEMTLDSLELSDVSFIKIDVEGYELNVLRGATDTIAACRPVIVYEHWGDTHPAAASGYTNWQPADKFEEFFRQHEYTLVNEPTGADVFAYPNERLPYDSSD